uniref:(northern house mosquito) hypothetical protein n=1 Tax=Culex pipiens TaxID=7175 RepID=A0A8D8FJ30_CULPI
MKVILAFCAILGLTAAQREDSLNVISSLRQVQPAYRDLQNFVVSVVSNAKINSSDVIFAFHEQISLSKESFLRSAIGKEASTLYQINGQNQNLDASCLNLLRSSIEVNINLAGVSFSNCITAVDGRLNAEISQIYRELELNETSFVNISIYDVFRGQNIFMNPQAITELLQAKLAQLQQSPTGLVAEMTQLVDGFRGRLDLVRAGYGQCLNANDQLLQTAVNTVLVQLQQICQGALIPDVTTVEPTPTPELTTPELTTTQGPETTPSSTPELTVAQTGSTGTEPPAYINFLPNGPPAVQPDSDFRWN